MNYLTALIIPPLGVLFAGHMLTATLMFFVWGACVMFLSPMIGHGVTVALAIVIMLSTDSSIMRFLLAAVVPPLGVMFNCRVGMGLILTVVWIGGMLLMTPLLGHILAVLVTYAVMFMEEI